MVLAAGLGIIPVIIIIAVAFSVAVWLVRFIAGIKKTNDFYRQKMQDAEKEKEQGPDRNQLSEQDAGPFEE